jgi:adenylate cyclase
VLQAYAVDTLLRGSAPRPLSPLAAFGLGLAGLLALGLAFFRLPPPAGALAWLAAAALVWLGAALALAGGVLLPWIAWAAGAGLLLAAIHGYRLVIEGRERRQVLHAFRHYLSPALVERLANDPGQLKLGGERRRVAVMFVDLADFTPFSAQHADQPEQIVARLNALFQAVGDAVDASGGYVDKFMGDAVMGVWGAPAAADRPEESAACAAMSILQAVEALNAGQPPEAAFRIRIGLSAGEVVAGNLGSRQRYNYTVIGDAVNRAARLEEACKTHGEPVLADGDFVRALGPGFAARKVCDAQLRGLAGPIEICALASA